MKHLLFIGAWTGAGTDASPLRSSAADLWQAHDVPFNDLHDSGQPNVKPIPNVCIWECMQVEDAGLALLEANPNDYQILIAEDVT